MPMSLSPVPSAPFAADPDTHLVTLPNGVRVLTLRLPNVESVQISVFVRTGSRHESRLLNGISHVVEHMAFKGTTSRSCQQINLDAERLGADVNAHTDKDHTAYHMRGLARDAARFVGMLGMHGTYEANWAMNQADLIVCLGATAARAHLGRAVRINELGTNSQYFYKLEGETGVKLIDAEKAWFDKNMPDREKQAVAFVPEWGRHRLEGMLNSRPDWSPRTKMGRNATVMRMPNEKTRFTRKTRI